MPARVVIDRDGIIRAVDTDPDYTRRSEPARTVEILRGLRGQGWREGAMPVAGHTLLSGTPLDH